MLRNILTILTLISLNANAQSIIFGEVFNEAPTLSTDIEGEWLIDNYNRIMNPHSIQYYSGNYIGRIEHDYWRVLSFEGIGQFGVPIYKNKTDNYYILEGEYEIAAEFIRTTSDPYFYIGIYNKGLEINRIPFRKKTFGKFNSYGIPIEFEKISFKYEGIDEAIDLFPAFISNKQMESKVYIKTIKYKLINKYSLFQ